MATIKKSKTSVLATDPFAVLEGSKLDKAKSNHVHIFGNGFKCRTESRGYSTPENRGILEIIVDASGGFIPLWEQNTTLRWRFQEAAFAHFANPKAAKTAVRKLFGRALLAWENAVPVKFSERKDNWDFEIAVREADDCDSNGCTLAMAFFPDSGQHEFVIFPKMFSQDSKEQMETLEHELGHVFGLRHFFALLKEKAWPAQAFGTQDQFSIMNYGDLSELTPKDKEDLMNLYRLAWSGELTHINETKIRFIRPHSAA